MLQRTPLLLLLAAALPAAAPRLSAQDASPPDSSAADSAAARPLPAPLPDPADSAAAVSPRIGPPQADSIAAPVAATALSADSAAPRTDPAARPVTAAGRIGPVALLPFLTVGGAEEEALRMAQLRGEETAVGFLLRAPSSLTPWGEGRGVGIAVLAPRAVMGWNSAVPFGLNDGSVWAGRGTSVLATAGFAAQAGPVRLVVAPEVVYAQNAGFDSVIPPAWLTANPHRYIPPWQRGEHSIDLPYRMGNEARNQLRAGQSSLTVTAGPVAVGASTENQWWGPGIRNALVLSNQGPGVEHLFLRTSRPLRTPVGWVEARWIAGALRESRWFRDTTAAADSLGSRWRSFSAAAVVVSPSRWLSVGLARSVYAQTEDRGGALGGAADAFTRFSGAADTASAHPYEQITAVWARIVVPEEGAEAYVEWARTRMPGGVRGLLETPEHTQGYTVGLQWLRPLRGGSVRLQAEHTYVEESPTFAWMPTGSWYASALVPQGYTNEGQGLGAAVGPGGSGQWFALDWLRGRGRGGVFLNRIRWAQDAYYDKPGGHNRHLGYDLTMYGGVRGALPVGPLRLDVEYGLMKRWNYLFQSRANQFQDRNLTVNVENHTLRLGITAVAPRLGPR
jgi:Capsule assembly protein Wzi